MCRDCSACPPNLTIIRFTLPKYVSVVGNDFGFSQLIEMFSILNNTLPINLLYIDDLVMCLQHLQPISYADLLTKLSVCQPEHLHHLKVARLFSSNKGQLSYLFLFISSLKGYCKSPSTFNLNNLYKRCIVSVIMILFGLATIISSTYTSKMTKFVLVPKMKRLAKTMKS